MGFVLVAYTDGTCSTERKVCYMMQTSLPERLRVLRAQRGLTLVEAAAKAGIGRDTLSDIERGRRHPVMPTLAKIAKGYGVPVEDLLNRKEGIIGLEDSDVRHEGAASFGDVAPPSPGTAEETEEKRLENLRWYIAKIQSIAKKRRTEIRELHRVGDDDGLNDLLFEMIWTHAGLVEDLEDEEALEEHTGASDEWQVAKVDVLHALMKLDDLVDEIKAVLENPQAAERLADPRRRRAKSA